MIVTWFISSAIYIFSIYNVKSNQITLCRKDQSTDGFDKFKNLVPIKQIQFNICIKKNEKRYTLILQNLFSFLFQNFETKTTNTSKGNPDTITRMIKIAKQVIRQNIQIAMCPRDSILSSKVNPPAIVMEEVLLWSVYYRNSQNIRRNQILR